MEFNAFIDYINQNRKRRITFDNIKEEFIKKGYEKFLFLTYSEEKTISSIFKEKIKRMHPQKVSDKLLPIIKVIKEEHPDDFLTMFFSYSPNKKYYMAKEISSRAYKSIILPNLYNDDPSLNHMVIFKKSQVKDALLLSRSIRNNAMDGLATYSIFGGDVLYLTDLCSFNDIPIRFPKPNPLTHFCGNMTRRDNDPYLIKQSREIIEEIMKRNDFEDEFQFSFSVRRYLMEFMQMIYENNQNYFLAQNELGMLNIDCKEELEQLYSDLVAKNKAPVKWKSEKQLFDLVYSVFPDTLFQHLPEWLAPQSLDIYVPSLRLAIEYQGIQHYESVDFFGGEEGLKRRKELDEKKKRLCRDNGVILIEWHYQDTITKTVLRKKMKENLDLTI